MKITTAKTNLNQSTMKTYLPILLLLISINIQAQQTIAVLDSVYYYESSNGQDWVLSSLIYNDYNSEAKIIEKRNLYKNGHHGWSTDKEIYHYNIQKRQDTITLATWSDTENDWYYHTQRIYKYNSDNNLIRIVNQQWNETTQLWEIFTSTTLEYDNQNRWINQLSNEVNRRTRTYDDNNRLTRDVFEYLENNQWLTLYSTIYEYNVIGQITRLYYSSNTFNPPIFRETIYTYNNQHLRTSQVVSETNAWGQIPPLKDTFIYNVNNQLVERQKADWINDKWIWFNSRYLYEYDVNENPAVSLIQIRHTANHNWQNSSKDEIFYNADNRETDTYRYMIWDTINTEWYDGEWTNYIYNQNNQLAERTIKNWENNTNDYTENYSKLINYYSEKTITCIEPPGIEENCLFLNPYLPYSTIHCDNWEVEKMYQIQVFSIDGKLVYSNSFLGCDGFQIDKSLQKGWYVFVILEDENVLQKQKILIFE